MKKNKILYWVFTTIIVLFDGVMPALTGNSEMAKQGISHLGYPDYFRVLLTCFKVAGAIVLIVPQFGKRLKEWAYAGFTFDFICASVSHAVIDGFGFDAVMPLIVLAILMGSYYYYHKIQSGKTEMNLAHAV